MDSSRITQKLSFLKAEGQAALARAKVVFRVGKQKELYKAVNAQGAKALLRELSKGKQNHSALFRFLAANSPHQIAITCPYSLLDKSSDPFNKEDRHYSYLECDRIVDSIASALSAKGIAKGSAAVIALKNRPEFIFLQIATGRTGAAAVSASFRSSPPELGYLIENSGANILFFDADIAPTIQILKEISPHLSNFNFIAVGGNVDGFESLDAFIQNNKGQAFEDQSHEGAVVMYTSGTTGKPKGAVRRIQRSTLANVLAFIGETPMRIGDIHLAVCPLYHATAFAFVGMSLMLCSQSIILPEFRPELFLAAIERYRVTTTAVVPTMLYRILELGPDVIRRYDLSSLKAIFSGGAPLSASLARDVMHLFGDILFNFYGATETGIVTLATPDDLRASPGTIGRTVEGVDIQLIGEDGREVPDGAVGELYARSNMMIDGYHADENATQNAMRSGFFSVGDLARRDRRGCYFIEGRKRDMIISGGVNVYPAEVEAVLDKHPAVFEAAVVGVQDKAWGERVRAYIVRRPNTQCTDEELQAFCRASLAGPKVPREIIFIDELPKNPTGKVLKRELRAQANEEIK